MIFLNHNLSRNLTLSLFSVSRFLPVKREIIYVGLKPAKSQTIRTLENPGKPLFSQAINIHEFDTFIQRHLKSFHISMLVN